MARKIFQLLLCAATLPFYPFVLLFAARMLTPSFWSEAASFTPENWVFFLIYPAAAIGIPVLFLSIFLAPATIKRTTWLAWFVVIGLVAGSFTAVMFLSSTVPAHFTNRDASGLAMSAWQLGGPLVVAIWNLARLWSDTRRSGSAAS